MFKANEKIIRERRRRYALRWGIGIFVGVLLVTMGILLARSRQLQLETIVIEGNQVLEAAALREVVYASLEGNHFLFIPKTAVPFLSVRTLAETLQRSFPRIDTLSIRRQYPDSLTISIVERKGVYLWCGETFTSLERLPSHPCWFTDADGIIFAPAPYFSGVTYPVIYGAINRTDALPWSIANQEMFFFSVRVFERVAETGLVPSGILLGETESAIILDTPLHPTLPGRIIVSPTKDIEVLTNALRSVLASKVFNGNTIQNMIEYIDLRFGDNHVYYKLRKTNPVTL